MKKIEDKKIIGCITLAIIFFLISFVIYGQTKSKVFKDEYMESIFVDEEIDSDNAYNKGNIENEMGEVILKKDEVTVEIKGEVKNPNVYTLEEGAIINDLINIAGGLTSEANIGNINRAKTLKNEDLIIVGNINISENVIEGNNTEGIVTKGNIDSKDNTVNINTASISELMNIDGVGEKTAQKIIDYREENGGFKSIEDIKNVDRIGDKTFEKMKEQISC